MSFVVVYDANVLYGNTLRDLLIRLAMTGRLQAKGPAGFSTRCSVILPPIVQTFRRRSWASFACS